MQLFQLNNSARDDYSGQLAFIHGFRGISFTVRLKRNVCMILRCNDLLKLILS